MKITDVAKANSEPELVALNDEGPSHVTSLEPDGSLWNKEGPHHYWWDPSTGGDSKKTAVSTDLIPVTPLTAPAGVGRPDGLKYAVPMARWGRLFASRLQKRRLVQKNGDSNVKNRNVTKRKRKYIVDIFTTLVDMKWRYHLTLFSLAFVVTWCLFGGVWYGIAVHHLDDVNADNETWEKCVDNVYDYHSALLFSIETQTTIGYGSRVIQPRCRFGIFVMMFQSCLGLFIQSLITGIIFSKISRPKGRAQTIMFSEKAAVCKRDGEFYLTFRVGDMRKSHIIGTSIRALLVKNRLTAEGESIPLCQYPLTLETETSRVDCFVFLIWPVTVVHRIDATSPLWELSPEKLLTDHFEIIVILEGTVESTGMSTQLRTSYIPTEIRWGERLVPLLTFQLQDGHYEIDYKQFHNTTPMLSMPDYSAKEYAERQLGVAAGDVGQREVDYPVSFTAPAVRAAGAKTPTSRALHSLFPRSVEAIKRRRALALHDGAGGSKAKAKEAVEENEQEKRHSWSTTPTDAGQQNRAYQPHHQKNGLQDRLTHHHRTNYSPNPSGSSASNVCHGRKKNDHEMMQDSVL